MFLVQLLGCGINSLIFNNVVVSAAYTNIKGAVFG
jgi:hypothetical protein